MGGSPDRYEIVGVDRNTHKVVYQDHWEKVSYRGEPKGPFEPLDVEETYGVLDTTSGNLIPVTGHAAKTRDELTIQMRLAIVAATLTRAKQLPHIVTPAEPGSKTPSPRTTRRRSTGKYRSTNGTVSPSV